MEGHGWKGNPGKWSAAVQEAISRRGQDQSQVGSTKDSLGNFVGGGRGAYLSQGARSSCGHSPGLQATLGALGMQPSPQGAMSAWPLRQQRQLGVLCGAGRGRRRRREPLGEERQAAVSTCLLPAPLPRTGLASLGYERGAGTMGVLCLGEALRDPRPLRDGGGTASGLRRQVTPLLGLPRCQVYSGD